MTSDSGFDFLRFRDGTSQQQRMPKALNPDYFQMDERSLKDLLEFARKYSETLSFYNSNNKETGNWSAFMEGDLNEMVAYLKNPNYFDHQPAKLARYSKPHFALFLSFLALLQEAQVQMNTITQRQLDFYYQKALELQPKSGRADQVHLFTKLEPDVDQVFIPKGTQLVAGEDEEGNPILYQMEDDLLSNQARIAKMMSLHVEKDLMVPARIRELNNQAGDSIPIGKGTFNEEDSVKSVFLEILKLVYRLPDTENTPRRYPNNLDSDSDLNFGLINELDELHNFIEEKLHIRVTTFQHLVELFRAWENPLNWDRPKSKRGGINDYLIKAGDIAGNITKVPYPFSDPFDFDENFKNALKVDVAGQRKNTTDTDDNIFKDLEGVNDFYQLYSLYLRIKNTTDSRKDDVIQLIVDTFKNDDDSLSDFEAMMQLRVETLEHLKEIIRILSDAMQQAGKIPGAVDLDDFKKEEKERHIYEEGKTLSNLFKIITKLDPVYISGEFSDDYFKIKEEQLQMVETYFKMSAEDFFFIRGLYFKPDKGNWKFKDPAWKWRRADELFEKAHRSLLGQDAVPEIARWKNLYIARDASQVIVPGFTEEEELPRWKTFGKVLNPENPNDQTSVEVGELGFIFSSSALSLAEGIRTLTLTLTFEKESFEKANLEPFLKELLQSINEIDATDDEEYPFRIEVSTEKEWIFIDKWDGFSMGEKTFIITLVLDEEIPPLAPLAEEVALYPFPALKFSLVREEITASDDIQRRRPYEFLKDLLIEEVQLDIRVEDIKNLQIQNVQGSVPPNSPFQPFGFQPQVGDRFFITHPEIAAQRMDSIQLNLKWKNFPEGGLFPHYQLYAHVGKDLNVPEIDNGTFGVKIALREAHRHLDFNPDDGLDTSRYSLFSSTSTHQLISLKEDEKFFEPNFNKYQRNPYPKLSDDVQENDRFLQVELLSPDFQHNRYSAILTTQALSGKTNVELTEEFRIPNGKPTRELQLRGNLLPSMNKGDFTVKESNKKVDIVNYIFAKKQLKMIKSLTGNVTVSYTVPFILPDPFAPELESISLDYSTSVTLKLPIKNNRTRSLEDPLPVDPFVENSSSLDFLFHLHPFGISDVKKNGEWIRIAENKETKEVTEKFRHHFLPKYEDEGHLYLGIENLRPPQSLSLLFQQAEGSGNPNLPLPKVEWAYLVRDNWKVMGSERIRRDTTNGLRKTGIIELAIPADADQDHTLMPTGIHWIRIGVPRHSVSLNNTIDIHTQALKATRIINEFDIADLGQALPPETIAELSQPIPGLSSLVQPYTSFNGKSKEQPSSFYRRVSERLRHKNRALTLWDYERLVLEQFPDIYKAKALSADLLDQSAPLGGVTIIVIPDIRFRRPFDPFEPKVPQGQLQEIEDYLQQIIPPFATVKVQNPKFDYLHVRAAVKFYDMDKFDFYADQLQQDLKQYLSPWAFDHSSEITFGRNIYLSVLVNFMENRPYVDYIDQPKMFLMERRIFEDTIIRIAGTSSTETDGDILLRGPDIILVTAPEHTIDYLDESIPPSERIFSGIGYAKLHLDFEVETDSSKSDDEKNNS